MARWATLAGAAVCVFGVTVAIGLRLTPPPRTETDYLVIGSAATFLSLSALFAVVLTTWMRSSDPFYKKRPKAQDGTEAPPSPDPPPPA